jgi:hypothetical protein
MNLFGWVGRAMFGAAALIWDVVCSAWRLLGSAFTSFLNESRERAFTTEVERRAWSDPTVVATVAALRTSDRKRKKCVRKYARTLHARQRIVEQHVAAMNALSRRKDLDSFQMSLQQQELERQFNAEIDRNPA